MKTSTKLIMFLMLSSSVWANDIYVTQSGNNLVLDITQSGTGNTIGTLAIPSSLAGADTNFTVVQNGNTNELTFELNGNNYTGNFDITGNSNTIDFKCDSGNSTSGCENITANITLSGGSSTVNLNIGENDDSTGTQVNITGTGDTNAITADVDSPAAELTLGITGSTNTFGITMSGSGVGTHKTTIDHTGTGGTFTISQTGINDKLISLTTSGNNANVTITQED